jgi:hypothetical protein
MGFTHCTRILATFLKPQNECCFFSVLKSGVTANEVTGYRLETGLCDSTLHNHRLQMCCRVYPLTRSQQIPTVKAAGACLQSVAICSLCSSLADFSTLKTEAICSSETSVHTRTTRRHIPEGGILHNHRCENLKSYLIKRLSL